MVEALKIAGTFLYGAAVDWILRFYIPFLDTVFAKSSNIFF